MTKPATKGPSLLRRREVVEALRRGTVPRRGLELFAVGMGRLDTAFDEELDAAAAGRGVFKALRGDFGCGKSFTSRWLQARAQRAGFATAEVQISENDTPLHRLETVYRRAMEALSTREWAKGAFRQLIESWFFSLEEEVLANGLSASDPAKLSEAVGLLLEGRLAEVSAIQPQFAAALRACHSARVADDAASAEGLMAWLMGQPHVAAGVKRKAGIKGDIDHTGAMAFLRGLLTVLRQTGRAGLLLVLDEVETIQRVRADSRERSLNAIRQLIDDLYAERFPGLYVLITGTPAFFDGPQGVKRAPALAQRLHVSFSGDPRFDNARAIQVRLLPFDHDKLVDVGRRVRDLYVSENAERIFARVGDDVVENLARGVAGKLGGKTGVAPRIFLRKLVDLLDRVDEHPDFNPTDQPDIHLETDELTVEERTASGLSPSVDDIKLEL
ncbi:MAG: BREX system ATP-binding protein BrxD [Deltaproteobacteria bacterium]|nr:BREX system ATP-binding protein BrxD [Deltaproteobacteria bacterium]